MNWYVNFRSLTVITEDGWAISQKYSLATYSLRLDSLGEKMTACDECFSFYYYYLLPSLKYISH